MKDFLFGTDYYPEHWPKERWETDARMMREMGLDVVRLAEFSWFKMEPAEGAFNFEWLDEAIDMLGSYGIKVILGTPTAAPPAWIIRDDPEIQPVDQDGLVHGFGGRHHDCQSNPHYREHVKRFVTAFARRYGNHPNVIGWQVDNELGNSHGDLCHCRHCQAAFQQWLQKKYVTIDALNERWGTAFWSQGYQSFAQVDTPKKTAAGVNPSHALDWKRFCSDLVLEFHELQAAIIRKYSPDRFITQNMMGFSDKFRYDQLAESLEFVSHDQYPGGHFKASPSDPDVAGNAAPLDFMRAMKDAPFSIMEQQSSITGWEVLGRAPQPGQLAMWSAQCIAHGADAIMWFRWRSCIMGTEEYWHGLLPHSGRPKRNFRELSEFVQQMKPILQELQGAMPPKQAAILYSYDQNWAIQIQPHHPRMRYVEHMLTMYKGLQDAQIPIDFTFIERDLSSYKLVVAPLWFLTDPDQNEKLRNYVRNGGTLVLDMRSGVKDQDNICVMDQPLPAGLDDLAGVEVDEYDCLIDVPGNTVVMNGKTYECSKWCDIMHTTTAETRAVWGKEFYQGTPAITCNVYGKGRVWYIGTEMSDILADDVMKMIAAETGVVPVGTADAMVELLTRKKEGKAWLFALNHSGEEKHYHIDAEWKCVMGQGSGILEPFGIHVFTREV